MSIYSCEQWAVSSGQKAEGSKQKAERPKSADCEDYADRTKGRSHHSKPSNIEMNRMLPVLLSSITLLALACSHPLPGRGAGEVETSSQSQTSFKVETVIGNLEVPWSIVWAPDGRMIFTERPGRVRVYE